MKEVGGGDRPRLHWSRESQKEQRRGMFGMVPVKKRFWGIRGIISCFTPFFL